MPPRTGRAMERRPGTRVERAQMARPHVPGLLRRDRGRRLPRQKLLPCSPSPTTRVPPLTWWGSQEHLRHPVCEAVPMRYDGLKYQPVPVATRKHPWRDPTDACGPGETN